MGETTERSFDWGTFWCALFLSEAHRHGTENFVRSVLIAALTAGLVWGAWRAWRYLRGCWRIVLVSR